MYVVTKTAILSNRGGIPRGTILPVHENDGCYVVASGHYFEGVIISPKEIEPFWPYQEMIRLSEEALELKKRYEQAVQDRELLQRKIDELTSERKELLETIERAADEQKVVIPKEVAEAIEQARMSGHEWELFYSEHINQKADRSIRHFQVIADYMKKITNVKTYFSALINGYTTKEAALEEQVNRMLHEWLEADYQGDEETDRRMFAKKLVGYIKGELAKSG